MYKEKRFVWPMIVVARMAKEQGTTPGRSHDLADREKGHSHMHKVPGTG